MRSPIGAVVLSVGVVALPTVGRAHAGTVSGIVTADDVPVADARVTLYNTGLFYFQERRTGPDGSYLFDDAPNGPKFLGVAAPGFGFVENIIDVSAFPWVQNFALAPETETGSWTVVGNTLPELFDATDIGILLTDGTVFYCHDTVDPIRFDPVTGEKTFPNGTGSEQGCMNATVLGDGRFIMVGGQDGSDPGNFQNAIPWVKTYDLDTNIWALLEDMQHDAGRWYPGLARLADGSMLVMGGGQAPDAARTDTCERFDLATETWTYTDSMFEPTEFPPSALLHTGEVLMTWYPPQLYDPVTETWRLTANFNQPARGYPGHSDHSLIVLEDGRALAMGVRGNPSMGEVFDPITETWSPTSNPGLVRFQSEVVQLPDGNILVAGGETEDPNPPVQDVLGIVRWSDLYHPADDTWRQVPEMAWHREYHAVTLLVPDGRVLTTGGTHIKFQVGPTSADIEAYSPPYLFRGVRPQITDISSAEPRRGDAVTLEIAPATQLTSVVLLGSQVTTHWVDGGVRRRLVLPVSQQGSTAVVDLPCDGNLLPLGHYLLFAMVDDIPSVARIVNVRARAGDINGDGVVNVTDLVSVILGWGPCPASPPPCQADVDGNGVVDVVDLLAVILGWGACG